MSDTEQQEPVAVAAEEPLPKRPISEKQRQNLIRAREKAVIAKREKAEARKKKMEEEIALRVIKEKQEAKERDNKISEAAATVDDETPVTEEEEVDDAPQVKQKKVKKGSKRYKHYISESDDSDSSDSESDDSDDDFLDNDRMVISRKQLKNLKNKYRKRIQKHKAPKQPATQPDEFDTHLKQRVYDKRMELTMKELFPNLNL